MNTKKFIRNDNKLDCVICFECPNKIIKCNVCYDSGVCVKCFDELEYMDELNMCDCCSGDSENDTRLFLLRKCPICRSICKNIVNEETLKNYSKKRISKLIVDYNKRTIDRVNRNIGVNRFNRNIPVNNYFSDSEEEEYDEERENNIFNNSVVRDTRRIANVEEDYNNGLLIDRTTTILGSDYLTNLHSYRDVNNYYRIDLGELWGQMNRMRIQPSF